MTVQALDLAAWVQRVVLSRKVPPPPAAITRGLGGEASLVQANGLGEGLSARGSVVMKMDIEGSEFSVLSRMLTSGVLCSLDAAAIEWHDERTKGTRPIHAATGAPSNFSGLLNYAVGSSRQARDGDGGATKVGGNSATGGAGLAGCGVNLVDLATDGT